MNIFKHYKEKKATKVLVANAKREASYNEAIRCAMEKLMIVTDEMTRKPCPIQQGNCFVECVHFQEGHPVASNWLSNDGSYIGYWANPKCKLWK